MQGSVAVFVSLAAGVGVFASELRAEVSESRLYLEAKWGPF